MLFQFERILRGEKKPLIFHYLPRHLLWNKCFLCEAYTFYQDSYFYSSRETDLSNPVSSRDLTEFSDLWIITVLSPRSISSLVLSPLQHHLDWSTLFQWHWNAKCCKIRSVFLCNMEKHFPQSYEHHFSLFSQRYISMGDDDVSHFFAVYKSTSTWLVFICYMLFSLYL